MDLGFWLNSLLVTLMLFGIVMLFALMWWVSVFVLYAPSFRLRKLKKLIREDNMEYNEILAEKSRLNIEKANTQLQYDNLVIRKSEVQSEIKDAEKEREIIKNKLALEKSTLDALAAFVKTPSGHAWLQAYTAEEIFKEQQDDQVVPEEPKAKTKKKG